MIDLPAFLDNPATKLIKQATCPRSSIRIEARNQELISEAQLLLDFFHFYGFTFQRDKFAIDIRRSGDASSDRLEDGPFCLREELIA